MEKRIREARQGNPEAKVCTCGGRGLSYDGVVPLQK